MEMCDKCYIVHDEEECPLCIANKLIQALELRIEKLQNSSETIWEE